MSVLKVLLVCFMAFNLCACSQKTSILEKGPVLLEEKQLDKHHYTLDVTLDTINHTIGGKMQVMVKNNSKDDWQEIDLRDYASVLEENSKQTTFHQIDDGTVSLDYQIDPDDCSIVHVFLNTPLKSKESMILNVSYTSYLLTDIYSRFNYTETIQDEQTIGQYVLGNFYPVLSYYEDGHWVNHPYFDEVECFYTTISDYDVTITTPKDYIVSATSQASEQKENETTITRVYHAENVRDFAMSAANDYQVLSTSVDGITIYSYFYEGTEENGQKALDEAVNGMQLFNRYLGKYPYDTFSIASVPSLRGGGMEYPGYVMILDRYYYRDQGQVLSTAVVHELAHQWFYGIVGNDQYDMPWLDESLASEMQVIYLAYFYPEQFELEKKWFDNGLESEFISKAYNEFASGNSYVNCAYREGQKFLELVREEIGEENFIAALQTYTAKYAYLEAKTENLIEILNQFGKDDLLELYKIYLEPEYYQ